MEQFKDEVEPERSLHQPELVVPKADKYYLCFGGGVNSTALLLWLVNSGIWDERWEAVFCDPGAELPETYDYLRMVQREICPVTVLKTLYQGLPIYDYAYQAQYPPLRFNRWCTVEYKLKPLNKYCAGGIQVVGIDYGERERAERANQRDRERLLWHPLVELGWSREDCVRYIQQCGYPVPPKSGCFFCPFRSRAQWRHLFDFHPDLFQKAVELEELLIQKAHVKGVSPNYLSTMRKPLSTMQRRILFHPQRAVVFRTKYGRRWQIAESVDYVPRSVCGKVHGPAVAVVPYEQAASQELSLCHYCQRALELDYQIEGSEE